MPARPLNPDAFPFAVEPFPTDALLQALAFTLTGETTAVPAAHQFE
ncbi:MAG: hypothetical protein ABMA13_13040 [Chthoniobacteraceae bacterium]